MLLFVDSLDLSFLFSELHCSSINVDSWTSYTCIYISQKKADLKLMFKSFTRPLVEKTIVVSIIAIPVIYIMLCMTLSERTEHSDAVSNEFGFDYDDSFFLTETTGAFDRVRKQTRYTTPPLYTHDDSSNLLREVHRKSGCG